MAEAVALGEDARGRTRAQPQCRLRHRVDARARIVGKGATARGRTAARRSRRARRSRAARRTGATVYVTLEPCAHAERARPGLHRSPARGEAGAGGDRAQGSRPAHCPGKGIRRLRAGRDRSDARRRREAAQRSLSGWLTRLKLGRPRITLKLALSIDGKIALPSGESKWITGEDARAPRSPGARAQRHDPGRARHLSRRRSHASTCACRGSRIARRGARCSPAAKRVDGWEILRNPRDVLSAS